MLHIWTLFAFEDDATGFEGLESVPNAFWDVHAVDAFFMTENVPFIYFKVIINPLFLEIIRSFLSLETITDNVAVARQL